LWVVDKSAGGSECKNVARKIVNLEYYEQVEEASIEKITRSLQLRIVPKATSTRPGS
jgi:hypothetical protein